jgi:hypothetical protein
MCLRGTPVSCDRRLLIAVECSFVITHNAAERVTSGKMAESGGEVAGLQEKSGKRTFLMSIMCQFSAENIQPFL